jgi:hypothetical protein
MVLQPLALRAKHQQPANDATQALGFLATWSKVSVAA